MISTLIELLALAGLVKTASFVSALAAWLVGSLGLLFVGYALGESPVDVQAGRLIARARVAWRRQLAHETTAGARRSPHPPIRIDPETQRVADAAAAARLRRAARGDRTPALSRYDNGDGDADEIGR